MLPNNYRPSCVVDNIQAFYSSDYGPNPSVPNSEIQEHIKYFASKRALIKDFGLH
jgi:hypothetical protein